ncbi:Sugar isomerase (SIS) [Penicillium macrosclerotiorum]|uniref:Sugar isomerase (SIS) n=1 Tax=Penicillium macrosclerotiorum TaxID=303699 RepID=UPI0025473DB9|nr:Sugar isomerase (SIS) [Penicillium macrosclerotiorum]KAJ5669763.1 Sugar isomerase (SIS) [Penicillium macrosclerotiorum]
MAPAMDRFTLPAMSISASLDSIAKQQPSWPLTPPDPSDPPPMTTTAAAKDVSSIVSALHVMSTERAALAHLEHLYQTDTRAQQDLARAVDQIARSVRDGGKLVISGVGKSGKIGRKIEATMTSLGIYSAFLHPTEALHGDLGLVRPDDTMLLISFSGRSPELLALLPHIPLSVTIIALTSHIQPSACPLLSLHGPSGMGILLPAPVHEDEEISLGVSAPTSSTTVALCLGDALAIATARKLHITPGRGPAEVFRSYHPGGAIGAAVAGATTPLTTPSSAVSTSAFDSPSSSISLTWEELSGGAPIPPFTLQPPPEHRRIPLDMLVPLHQIPTVSTSTSQSPNDIRLLDILLTAIQHPNAKSWVFLSPSIIVPPRRIRSLLSRHANVDLRVSEAVAKDSGRPLAVPRANWFLVPESTPLAEIRRLVSTSRGGPDPVSVIAVVKDMTYPASCIGVLEAEDLWGGRKAEDG